MARYLSNDAYLVSYGAMSKQPLSLPTSLFIFKNLTAKGFWQSQWYLKKSAQEREELMKVLVGLIGEGKVCLFNDVDSTRSLTCTSLIHQTSRSWRLQRVKAMRKRARRSVVSSKHWRRDGTARKCCSSCIDKSACNIYHRGVPEYNTSSHFPVLEEPLQSPLASQAILSHESNAPSNASSATRTSPQGPQSAPNCTTPPSSSFPHSNP